MSTIEVEGVHPCETEVGSHLELSICRSLVMEGVLTPRASNVYYWGGRCVPRQDIGGDSSPGAFNM